MTRPFDKRLKYTLTVNSVAYALTLTPSNNLGIEYSRSERYFGVIRALTASLEFKYDQGDYLGGAQALIDAFELNGIWAVASLLIETRDTQNPTLYNTFFTGVADFASIEIERNYVKLKFIESNDVQKLFKRDNITVNLNTLESLDGETITDFDLYKTTFFTAQDILFGTKLIVSQIADYSLTQNVGSEDFEKIHPITGTIEYSDTNSVEWPSAYNSYKLFTAKNAADVTFSSQLEMKIKAAYSGSGFIAPWEFYAAIIHYDSDGVTVVERYDAIIIEGGSGDPLPLPDESYSENEYCTHTFSMDIDDYLVLETSIVIDNSTNPSSEVDFEYDYNYNTININELADHIADFTANTIPAFEAFKRCLQLITSNNNPLISEILQRTDTTPAATADGAASLVQISNGFMLRSMPKKDVAVAFYNLFNSFGSCFNIGMWYNKINSQFEINPFADFYDSSTIILELGEVSNLLITVDEENYFNEIDAGQKEKVDYAEYGGLEEFNVKTTYTTVIDKIQNKLDIASPYRTDGFGIMFARSDIQVSKDNEKIDNAIWLIDCKRGTSPNDFETISDEDFTVINNVLEADKKLNLNFSPKRCILRNSNRISPCLEYKNSDLKFQESQFNSNLQTQKTGESAAITENENITFAELDDPLFSCLLYKFSYPVTALTISTLDANPHGLITFMYKNEVKSGFLKRVSCDYPNKQGEWLLQKYS